MPAARSSRRDVADLLNAQSTLALATCDADGTPGIAPLFYLPDSELLAQSIIFVARKPK